MSSWAARASLLAVVWLAAACSGDEHEAVAPAATAPPEPRLLLPLDVEVDGAGRIYVADAELHQVLRFDPASGETEVVAGTGESGSEGDDGPAVEAQIAEPTGLALAGDGTLYVADFPENRIRRIDPDGTISTAGEILGPTAVALDPAERTLAVPLLGHVLFEIDPATGASTRIAGNGAAGTTGDGGKARRAQIESPHGAAYDSGGDLFIPDGTSIRRIDARSRVITTVTEDLVPVKLVFGPDGTLYVVEGDPTGGTVGRVREDGTVEILVGTGFIEANGEGGPATEAGIQPSDVAIAPDGALIVSQIEPEPAVRRVDPATGVITTILR